MKALSFAFAAAISLCGALSPTWEPPAIVYSDAPKLDNPDVPPSWSQMPLGNGLLAASIWVEPPGDVVAYLSSPTAYDELHQLVKLGRIRISFTGAPFNDTAFGEVLFLSNATLRLTGRAGMVVRLWIDAHSPTLHVETEGADEDAEMTIATEIYRTDDAVGRAADVGGGWMCWADNVTQGRRSADVLLPAQPTPSPPMVAWYHRNVPTVGVTLNSTLWESELRNQGLGVLIGQSEITNDTLTNNTFGAAVVRTGGGAATVSPDGRALKVHASHGRISAAVISHEVAAAPTAAGFVSQLAHIASRVTAQSDATTAAQYANHSAWWAQYWAQSRVVVTATGNEAHDARLISLQAALLRR